MFTIMCIKILLLLLVVIYCTTCYNVLSLEKCENKLKLNELRFFFLLQSYNCTPTGQGWSWPHPCSTQILLNPCIVRLNTEVEASFGDREIKDSLSSNSFTMQNNTYRWSLCLVNVSYTIEISTLVKDPFYVKSSQNIIQRPCKLIEYLNSTNHKPLMILIICFDLCNIIKLCTWHTNYSRLGLCMIF